MIHNNTGVLEYEAIDKINGSVKRFTKHCRDKEKVVRGFQHVSGFPSDETIEHLVEKMG